MLYYDVIVKETSEVLFNGTKEEINQWLHEHLYTIDMKTISVVHSFAEGDPRRPQ